MKKALSVLLALCLLIGCLPLAAGAEESTGGDWSYDETTKTLTVTKQGRLTGGYYDWNAIRAEVEKVVLADGITEIASEAFEGFTSLTEVIIPDTVTALDDKIFVDCVKLSHVVIPASVTSFADSADMYFIGFGMPLFWNCPLLTTAGPIGSGCNIEFGWTNSIPASAFLGCDSLQSVILPEGIERIGDGAFGFTYLSSVTLPNSVKVLEDYAFLGCRRLTQVNIPAGVLRLGTESGQESSVFTECASLAAITVDSANPSYSDRDGVLFSKDGKKLLWCPPTITEYDIPEGVTAIAGHAFTSGVVRYSYEPESNLTRVTIPSTVTEICGGAFSHAAGLTEVTIPESVKTIGSSAFSGCTGLTEVTIPEGVKTIGSWAFSGCTGLTSVTVPASVTSMDFDIFADCTSLTEAALLGGGSSLTNTFTNCAQLETVRIQGSVEELSGTFEGCGKLKNVFLPAGLTSIYRDTFGDCLQLETVTYAGTQAQWDLIEIGSGNEPLTQQAQLIFTGTEPDPTPPTPPTPPSPSSPAVPCAALEEAVLAQAKAYGLLTYADGMDTAGSLTRLEMTKLLAGSYGAQIDTTADVSLEFSDCDNLSKADRAVINWAVTEHLMSGRPAGSTMDELIFVPEGTLSRAEVSHMLSQLLNMPYDAEYEGHFTDVEKHNETPTWFERPVNWLAEQGIFTTEGETFFLYDRAARPDVLRWLVAAYERKNNQTVSTVMIPAAASVEAGKSATLTPAIAPAINGPAYVWTSSNPSAATVENGVVTGVNAGTAVITIQLANGNSAACTVTVSGSSAPVDPSGPSGGGSSTPTTPDPAPAPAPAPGEPVVETTTAPDGAVTATTTWEDGKQAVAVKSPEGEKTITVTTATGEKVADVKLPAQPAEGKKFDDVRDGWYKSAVNTVTGYGLFNGTSDTTFSPGDGMTRSMLATVLYNLSGKPAYGTDTNVFEDVEAGKWYEDPVDWAYKMGVTSGTSKTEFSPNKNITREQLVTMLYRYANLIGAGSDGKADITGFPDGSKVAGFAKNAMQWAVAEGFISGRAGGGKNYIAPQGTATRAEVAAVLTRFTEYLKK